MVGVHPKAASRFTRTALVVALASLTLPKEASAASACFKDLGPKAEFGSDAQVLAIQNLAKEKCSVIGITFTIEKPISRTTLLVADLEKGEMIRLKTSAASRSLEKWTGFTREELLADHASDGFDVGTFSASRANEPPQVSESIMTFISQNRLTKFFPGNATR